MEQPFKKPLHPNVLSFTSSSETAGTGRISLSEDIIKQIRRAATEVELFPLPLDQGPYADVDGGVERLALRIKTSLGQRSSITGEILRRTSDVLCPYVTGEAEAIMEGPRQLILPYSFLLDDTYPVSDALPRAGRILADQSRYLDYEGSRYRLFCSLMEPAILAAAVLRNLGLTAYPSLAVLGQEKPENTYAGVISVFTNDDVPLRTFSVFNSHPPMDSLIVLGDQAATGVLHSIVAEIRSMRLCIQMSKYCSGEITSLPDEETNSRLKGIANALFECHKLWPGSPFLKQAISKLGVRVYAIEQQFNEEQADLSVPRFGQDTADAIKLQLLDDAAAVGREIMDRLGSYLNRCISKNKAFDILG
jgi:hypothetical protein